MQSSSETSDLERCQIGTILLTVSRSVLFTVSNFGLPSSFFSPVSLYSGLVTSIWMGQRM